MYFLKHIQPFKNLIKKITNKYSPKRRGIYLTQFMFVIKFEYFEESIVKSCSCRHHLSNSLGTVLNLGGPPLSSTTVGLWGTPAF